MNDERRNATDAADGRPATQRPADLWAEVPGPLRAAVVLVALESLALAAAGVFVIVDTLVGSPQDIGLALLAALFALGACAGLAFSARQLVRLQPAVRSPLVVVELLALPVGYSVGFDNGHLAYGAPVLLCALAVLFLLFTPAARAALDREPPR